MSVFNILDGDQQQNGNPTATRRQVLGATAAGATAALAGCQTGNNGSDEEPEDTPNQTNGEFSIEEFLVEGEQPEEYETEFLSGSNPEEVANELQPELNYTITGAEGPVETQVTLEYTDNTIPEGEPLNQTIEGETHQQNRQYTQKAGTPENLAEEILENPKNLQATFTATDTETGKTQAKQYNLDFGDEWVESAYQVIFNRGNYATTDADLQNITAEDGTISINYESQNEIGSQEFKNELAVVAGRYSASVDRTRIGYDINVSVRDRNGEVYSKEVDNDKSVNYLEGNTTKGEFATDITFNELLE
jgi:hypothetical protein